MRALKIKLYAQARLRPKNNPWEVAKKFVESYSPTNAVERNPGKKVQAKKLTAKHWPYYIVAELSLSLEHDGKVNLPIQENLVIMWPYTDRPPCVRTTGIPM